MILGLVFTDKKMTRLVGMCDPEVCQDLCELRG